MVVIRMEICGHQDAVGVIYHSGSRIAALDRSASSPKAQQKQVITVACNTFFDFRVSDKVRQYVGPSI